MACAPRFEPELIDDLLTRAVVEHPERTAVVSGAVRWSYRELGERVARAAAALQALGVRPEDRVAVLDKNSHYYLELYFALPRIGAVAVPLNYRLAPAELAYILRDSTATAWLFSADYADVVRAVRDELDGVRHFVCFERALADAVGYENLLSAPADAPRSVARRPDDTLLQMYTSGTTGRPKGAMLTHANMIANTLTALHERDYAGDDVYLHACPLYHCADLELYYGMTYACGGNVVLREFSPSTALRLIEQERVSVTFLVPAMIGFILETPDFEAHDISSLRLIVYGGAAIPVERLRQALAKLPCKLSQGYGLTETSPILCVLEAEDHVTEGPRARRIASCGKPARGVEVRVVDEDDAVCPNETVGEIVARGKNVMKGYWRAPEATREALRGGWFHTGDLGYFDADGFLYIVDRKKDMIVSGGENVYPREVEEVLYQHPDVLEAAVIGVPSERWGETVKAVVVGRSEASLTSEPLIAWCRERLAHYKAPTSVDFVPQLPRNPSGKVLKRVLRERYWTGHTRRVS
jgi:long-chain acyl-CoA synthetase